MLWHCVKPLKLKFDVIGVMKKFFEMGGKHEMGEMIENGGD